MGNSRDQMIAALREIVVPVLRDMGLRGSFPHFRRFRDTRIDLLTFQFNRYGGSLVGEHERGKKWQTCGFELNQWIHMILPFSFPAELIFCGCGSGTREETSGEKSSA